MSRRSSAGQEGPTSDAGRRGQRLRVAFLGGTLGQGGAEKQLVYCARALAEDGVDVRVYTLTRHELHEETLRALSLPPIWVGPAAHPLLRLTSLARLAGRFRPHVLQSFHSFANLYVGLVGRYQRAISVGALRINLDHSQRANGRWTPWLMRAPSGLCVNSATALRETVGRRYARSDQIYLLPNVIDLADFDRAAQSAGAVPLEIPRDDAGGCTVVFVGRLVRAKRLDRFLEAMALARSSEALALATSGEAPSVNAWIVGDGPERAPMEAMARRLGLSPQRVAFLGPRADVPGLLRQADVLVSSSDEEGTPNVLLEAMAAGLPVITTPAGDAGLVVAEGVTGYVVPFDGVEAMAGGIIRLAGSPALRRRLGTAGRRRVEEGFNYQGLSGRLLSIYRQIAQRIGNQWILDALAAHGVG